MHIERSTFITSIQNTTDAHTRLEVQKLHKTESKLFNKERYTCASNVPNDCSFLFASRTDLV